MGPIINNKVISLGFSTCPNDTFIFDAMVNGKVDTEGIVFEYIMEDVETLNKLAFSSRLDMTKISYSAFGFLVDRYVLLDAGSALGVNCGPLVVGLKDLNQDSINEAKVAIPGKYTTANFLFSMAFPKSNNKVEMVFSKCVTEKKGKKFKATAFILILLLTENQSTSTDSNLHPCLLVFSNAASRFH